MKSRRAAQGRAPASLTVLRAPLLSRFRWLVHGFSTRAGGVSAIPYLHGSRGELNLGGQPWDRPARVAENRRRFLDKLRATGIRLVVQEQIHSDLIRHYDEVPAEAEPARRGDGMMTNRLGLLLGILSADCLPVLLVDARQRVAAALHAGWRGAVRRIAQKGVGRMRLRFGSRPGDLRAAIGPGIRVCCYQIGEEVAAEFESQFLYAPKLLQFEKPQPGPVERKYPLLLQTSWKNSALRDGRAIYLDLVSAIIRQLQEAGIQRRNIWAEAPCTSCHPELFFSHRRDAGRTGRMMGVIGIRESR